ncbi:MAG: hypothetical protein MUE51_07130 [Thermoleophilia bacterium]|nr:hypothetical protein [Thermoleophilia bacterium]
MPAFRRPAWTYAGLGFLVLLGVLLGPSSGGRSLAASLVLLALLVLGVEILRRRTVAEFPPPA